MRYSLRTLLIVVTIAGIPLSWIAWARQTAAFHRREVVKIVHQIAEAEHSSLDHIQQSISILAQGRSVMKYVRVEIYNARQLLLRNGSSLRHGPDVVDPNLWGKGCYHSIIASRLDRAMFRPWNLIVEKRIEPLAVYTSLNDETWVGISQRDEMTDITPN